MPQVKGQALLCHTACTPWGNKAKAVFVRMGIRIRMVTEQQAEVPLSALCGPGPLPQAEGRLPEQAQEGVVVLCGLTQRQLDGVLLGLRRAGVPRSVYKAVLTQENAGWTFAALCTELARERSYLEENGGAAHTQY